MNTCSWVRAKSASLLLPAVLLTGCNSDLRRSEALELLVEYASRDTVSSRISWRKGAFDEWMARGGRNSERLAAGIAQVTNWNVQFEPRPQLRIDEVTGITEAQMEESSRFVEFRWHLEVPKPYERLVVTRGSGSAMFRRFDDGWRLSGSSITRSDSAGAPLPVATAADSSDIRDDLKKLQVALTSSRTPTRELYSVTDVRRGFRGELIRADTVVITDVDVAWTGLAQRVWFRCIGGVNLETVFSPAKVGIVIGYGRPGCPQPDRTEIVIEDEEARTRFFTVLRQALEAWQSRYSRLYSEPWQQ